MEVLLSLGLLDDMEVLVDIEELSLPTLNNSEYINHMGWVVRLCREAGAEAICVPAKVSDELSIQNEKLVDLLDVSLASNKTAVLHETDASRDEMITYVFSDIRNACKSPMEKKRLAGEELSAIVKPFNGIIRLPMNQKTVTIHSLVKRLAEPAAAGYIADLGLTLAIEKIDEDNKKYDETNKLRVDEMAEKHGANSTDIRIIADALYKYIVTKGEAAAIITPSLEAKKFVESMNNLIKETKTSYNQRTAQHKSHDTDEEEVITEEVIPEA